MEFSVDASEWNAMAKKYANATPIIEQELTAGMHRISRVGFNHAVRVVPVDTGRLKGSLAPSVKREGKDIVAIVGTGIEHTKPVGYAKAVEFGAGPHIIRPKNKRALFWPGAKHPVAYVMHPGNRAQPYLRPALQVMRAQSKGILADAMRKALARIGGR